MALAALICVVCAVVFHSVFAASQVSHVAILYSEDSTVQDTVVDELQSSLKRLAPVPVQTDVIAVDNIAALSTGDTPYQLIVTVGMRAALAYRDSGSKTDALYTLVPSAAAQSILPATPPGNAQVIHLDQPLDRMLKLLKTALPFHRDVGVLLGPTSAPGLDALEEAARRLDIALHVETLTEQADLITALERLLKRSQVLLAVPDSLIYNRYTVQKILLTTYRRQIPVVSFSAALVRAGATMAVHSSPEQIGRHVGETAADLLTRSKPLRAAAMPPRYYSVSVNSQVARSLGLSIPGEDELLKSLVESEQR